MKIYHSTDDAGKAGIESEGFVKSQLKDSPGCSYFHPAKTSAALTIRTGWSVIVDFPDDQLENYRYTDPDGEKYPMFCIPWSTVNERRPFSYEPADS